MPKRVAFRPPEAFLILARERSMSRAAERMGIAQPALGQQIQSPEARLGMPLFERDTRPLRLTEAGCDFQAEAVPLSERFAAAPSPSHAGSPGAARAGPGSGSPVRPCTVSRPRWGRHRMA